FITSVAGGSFNAGDTIQIQFEYAADTNTRNVANETPVWQIDSFKLTQGGRAQQSVSFSVAATASRTPVFYQWYRNNGSGFQAIAGANSATYSFVPVCNDNGAKYQVQIYIPGAQANSQVATLTVAQPNTPPKFALT